MSYEPPNSPHSFLWQNHLFVSDDVHSPVFDKTLRNVVAKIRSLHVFLTPQRADLHSGKLFGNRAILSMQNCLSSSITIRLLKIFSLIIFLFPVLNHLYLEILEEYSLGIFCTKLGKID